MTNLCRALCPGWLCCFRAMLSSCQAHFNCISSLMYVVILQLSSFGASGALAPHHCAYLSSQLFVSVHQHSASSVTQQILELCGSCRGQRRVCPLQFMARGHLYPQARTVPLCCTSPCLFREKGSASLHGEMMNQLVPVAGGVGFQCAVQISSSLGTLKGRAGGGCGFVLGRAG